MDMKKTNKQIFVDLTILTAVVLAAFGNTLVNGFVWDDNMYIVGNSAYQHLDLRRLLFTMVNGVQYLPARDLTLAFDYSLWGWRPVGFHLSNLLWYLGNIIAVYFLAGELVRLLQRNDEGQSKQARLVPLLVALLFAVHPLHSEVVGWVSCRGYLVAALFFFVSLILFIKFLSAESARTVLYFASLVSFLLSLFAMPHAIVLPLLLALCILSIPRERVVNGALATLPFFALAGIAFYVHKTIAVQTRVIAGAAMPGGIQKGVATAVQIPLFYLAKIVWPHGLSAVYDKKFAASLAEPRVIAAAGILIFALLTAVWLRKRFAFATFCILAFLIMLLPVLNIFPTNPVVADRYGYFPSFAVSLLAASIVGMAHERIRLFLIGATIVLSIMLASRAIAQNAVWRTDKNLMENAISVSPRAIKAYESLGSIYVAEGDFPKALEVYKKANELNPFDDTYDFLQGWLFARKRDNQAAIASFRKALGRNPYSMQVWYQMGLVYEELGDDRQAIDSYRNVLSSSEQDLRGKFRRAAQQRLDILLRKRDAASR